MIDFKVLCHQKDLDVLITLVNQEGGIVSDGVPKKHNDILVSLSLKAEAVIHVSKNIFVDIFQIDKDLKKEHRMLLGFWWYQGKEHDVTVISIPAIFQTRKGEFIFERKKSFHIK